MTAGLEQRLHFGQCFSFCFQVDGKVFVGRVHAHMPQPMSNGTQINTRTEQMDGSAMADGVWVNALVFQGGLALGSFFDVLVQNETDSKPGQATSVIIAEEWMGLRRR